MMRIILKVGCLIALIQGSLNAQTTNFCVVDHLSTDQNTYINIPPSQDQATARDGEPLCLRTVVHLIDFNTSEIFSDSFVVDLINQANLLLTTQSTDTALVHPIFRPLVDTEIQLILAQVDPEGNPTSGITRTETSVDYFQFDFSQDSVYSESVKQDSLGGKSAWDPERYLNIWIASMGDSLLQINYGVPNNNYFPLGTSGLAPGIPGFVLDKDIFLFPEQLIGLAPAPNILCHELGHALGLMHIWGINASSCDTDDFMEDTPDCTITGGGVCLEPLNTCIDSMDDKIDNLSNVMGYGCMLMFTPDQITTMKNNVLVHTPGIVLVNEGCGELTNTSDLTSDLEKESLPMVYPNPNNGMFVVEYVPEKNTDITIDFYDLLGNLIKSTSIFNANSVHQEFNLSLYADGIIVMVITANDKVCSKLISIYD